MEVTAMAKGVTVYPAEAQAARKWPEIQWRWCTNCKECWPATADFFGRAGHRDSHRFARWCKACFAERSRAATVARVAKKGATPSHAATACEGMP